VTDPEGTLFGLLLVAAVAWFWYASLQVRERATRIARDTCERQGLQFLEGTVALSRARPCRGPSGQLTLRRTYLFDYSSDGALRAQGFIVFVGTHLEGVGLAPAADG